MFLNLKRKINTTTTTQGLLNISFIAGSLILSILATLPAQAQLSCLDRKNLHSTGYLIAQNQLKVLIQDAFLPRNVKKSSEEKIRTVEQNIQSMWKSSQIKGFNVDSKTLAQLIVETSARVGVDYQILAAIVRKESGYCMFRLNKKGGDSGCMQFTSPAINELKHQFGLAGPGKYTPGVPEVLGAIVKKNFEGKAADKADKFKAWLSQDVDKMKRSLRAGTISDFDILSGAIFLKIKLAVSNGNYGLAVRNYNGSSKKVAYQKSVIGSAVKINDEYTDEAEQLCLEEHDYETEIRRNACDLTEDPVGCFNTYLQSKPNAT